MSLYGILRKKVAVGTGLNIYINQGGNGCEPMLARRARAVYPTAWPCTCSKTIHDLEALVSVPREAKEWISTHALKH